MLVGWHYLPRGEDDPFAPLGASTFLDLAPMMGMRSPERLCRPFFKGRPDPDVVAQRASAWHRQGCRVQLGNEPNLASEQFGGGPDDYAAWFGAVKAKLPGVRCYWAGMSPGVPGWEAWYAPAIVAPADGIAAHAYGTLDQMRAVVEALLWLEKPIWLAEVNFGAGQVADRDRWADEHLRPFLDWCSTVPQVEAVCYFAYKWPDPDMPLPTPVDGAGTGVERVLRAWTPPTSAPAPDMPRIEANGPQTTPTEGNAMPDWCPFATRAALPAGLYSAARDNATVPAMICDHIADGNGDPGPYWISLLSGPESRRASAHLWVSKTGLLKQYVPFSAQAWSNGPKCQPDTSNPLIAAIVNAGANPNACTISIEHEGRPGQVMPAAQVATSRRVHRWLSDTFRIPLDRQHVVGHDQFDRCTRANCPGPSFPWKEILMPDPAPKPIDYEAMAWGPIFRAHEALQKTGDQADAALAQAVHNATVLHKLIKGGT